MKSMNFKTVRDYDKLRMLMCVKRTLQLVKTEGRRMKKIFAIILALAVALCAVGLAEGEKVEATGVGQGIDGDVVVRIEADADTIYAVEVTEQNETVGIGSIAVEQLPGAIVAANSIAVDGVAGATVTSNAIKDAIRQALESVGIDPAPFETAPEAAAAAEKHKKSCRH